MNKRGISPLVATVIIIALTILVSVFFLNWLKNINKEVLDDSMCKNNVDMECLKLDINLGNVELLDGNLGVTLVSNSDTEITNVAIQAFSGKDLVASKYFESSLEVPMLDRFESKIFTINNVNNGITEVKVILGLEFENGCTGFCDVIIKQVNI